jgi:hypothetical protein
MTDHTLTSYFPDNLDDYAPWVAKHGLRAPYGKCQCGCGQDTAIAGWNIPARDLRRGDPRRLVSYHRVAIRHIPTEAQDGLTRAIPLTKGMVAIVDASDYEWLMQWTWGAIKPGRTYYASRQTTGDNGKKIIIAMHQLIAGAFADHINGNGLDNRRENLRSATVQQNNFNRPGNFGAASPYKGVFPVRGGRKWQASIKCNNQGYYLGTFESQEAAARAYDAKAKELFGEFAWLNFK